MKTRILVSATCTVFALAVLSAPAASAAKSDNPPPCKASIVQLRDKVDAPPCKQLGKVPVYNEDGQLIGFYR